MLRAELNHCVVGSFLGILLWIFYNILALLLEAVLVRVMAPELAERKSSQGVSGSPVAGGENETNMIDPRNDG